MDYYKVLGISYGASSSRIKLRYRELSKEHHPDKGGSQLRMAQINQAYQVLSNPINRARYDAQLRRQKLSSPPARQSTPWPAPRPQRPKAPAQQEVIFETPPPPKKQRRKGLWWTLVVGVTSACFIMIGLVAMRNVSVASPNGSQAAADKPAPTLAVDPPKDEPIISPTTSSGSPSTTTIPTPEQPAATQYTGPTLKNIASPSESANSDCSQKTLGFFVFSACTSDDDTGNCVQSKDHRHSYMCRPKR